MEFFYGCTLYVKHKFNHAFNKYVEIFWCIFGVKPSYNNILSSITLSGS